MSEQQKGVIDAFTAILPEFRSCDEPTREMRELLWKVCWADMPAGELMDCAVDIALGSVRPSRFYGKDGRRTQGNRYSRDEGAGANVLHFMPGDVTITRGELTRPTDAERESIDAEVLHAIYLFECDRLYQCEWEGRAHVPGDGFFQSTGELFWSEGNGDTLALAICRCLLHFSDGKRDESPLPAGT